MTTPGLHFVPSGVSFFDSVHKAPEIPTAREDRNEDPDWKFKPILKGAFSTRPSDCDGGDGYIESGVF